MFDDEIDRELTYKRVIDIRRIFNVSLEEAIIIDKKITDNVMKMWNTEPKSE